ncbi:MAG TPA: metallophosphoesterase [Methanobacteriaceae archaeon]|nr:metallophosphoesterase [Methanobacteriaceae archaeon]
MDNVSIYGAQIIDLTLVADDYLVISDLHLGYEEALNYQGVMVPKFQYQLIVERMNKIISHTKKEKIIISGDLKHEFGKISRQEWNETLNFIEFLNKHFQEIILIRGNHDPLTPIIASKTGLEVYKQFSTGNFLVMHGDQVPKEDIDEDTIIIGHEHPAVGLRSGQRMEKIKCFLKGTFKDKNLIVMPSFNFISEGSDVLHEKALSPFLKEGIGHWEVYGVEDFETMYFGQVEDLLKFQTKYI